MTTEHKAEIATALKWFRDNIFVLTTLVAIIFFFININNLTRDALGDIAALKDTTASHTKQLEDLKSSEGARDVTLARIEQTVEDIRSGLGLPASKPTTQQPQPLK